LINVVFAETALELIPSEIARTPQVVEEAQRRRKPPGEMLLDANRHFSAMNKLQAKEKRGGRT